MLLGPAGMVATSGLAVKNLEFKPSLYESKLLPSHKQRSGLRIQIGHDHCICEQMC